MQTKDIIKDIISKINEYLDLSDELLLENVDYNIDNYSVLNKLKQKVINIETCCYNNYNTAKLNANRFTYLLAGAYIGSHIVLYKNSLSSESIRNIIGYALSIIPINLIIKLANYMYLQLKSVNKISDINNYIDYNKEISIIIYDMTINKNNISEINDTKKYLTNVKTYLEDLLLQEQINNEKFMQFKEYNDKALNEVNKELLRNKPLRHDFIDFRY